MLNSRVIKIIAIVAMLVDHIGMILFPEIDALRIIGRIAMPLFCFLIAFGATKTRSVPKYLLRLSILMVISQFAINWAANGNPFIFTELYVFFSLALGVLAIYLIKKSPHPILAVFSVFLICALAFSLNFAITVDYHMAGILLIVLFHIGLRYSLNIFKITALLSLVVFNLAMMIFSHWWLQWYSMFAIVIITLFTDKRIKQHKVEKWVFYVFYPLHLVLLYIIKMLI